jgi:hypothetical protein
MFLFLFSNYSLTLFNFLVMFVFLFCMFAFYFAYSLFFIVLWIVSPFVQLSLSYEYFRTSLPTTVTGLKPKCSK